MVDIIAPEVDAGALTPLFVIAAGALIVLLLDLFMPRERRPFLGYFAFGTTLVATSGELVINEPGLLIAGADTTEISIGSSYTPNLMFHRSAIELAMRPPALPEGGDAADDVMLVQDPHSGLVFEMLCRPDQYLTGRHL